MAQQPARGARTVDLNVRVSLLGAKSAPEVPKAAAYAFSSGGRLLGREPLNGHDLLTLQVPDTEEAQAVRVLIGPDVGEKGIRIPDLHRRGATEKMLRVEPGGIAPTLEIDVIPDIWKCWLHGLCFVRGKLLKRIVSGGVGIDYPVCDANVEIYEVDPLLIILPRLPDFELERLRDIILEPPPLPPHDPFPPGPFPPGPVPPGPEMMPDLAANSPSPGGTPRLTREAPAAPPVPRHAMRAEERSPLPIPSELRFLARTVSTEQLRNVLLDHVAVIRPLLCWFFPRYVTTQLVATATTDECGRFQAAFIRGCHDPDQPDLYFRARQPLFPGFEITIYEPLPVQCHTYWDYPCGTEVTLYTDHPFAVTCTPCPPVIAPDNWALVMAVGNLPLSRIRGTGEGLQATTNASNIGLTDSGAPFGGLVRLRLEFDNSLREDLGVRYYQASYRQGSSGPFVPLTGDVRRHYAHMVSGELELTPYVLGPQTVNGVPNLFEIPPAVPPVGQWSIPDAVENTTSAKFPTTDLAPLAPPGVAWPASGKYQLKVDLFDLNGTPVNLAVEGIKFVVPTSTDLSGTIHTADAATLGLISGNSFVMTLHVDNSRCLADLQAPTLNGTPASPQCGVLEYDPAAPGSVTLDFTALHPNGFATYGFSVVRGANPPTTVLAQSGAVGGGSFSVVEPVNNLRGGCAIAGFSENLSVHATATDGWSRMAGYDAHDAQGFVLAPEEP